MAILIDELKDYLVAQGVGTFGTNLFIGFEPTTPKNLISLFPLGSTKPPSALGDQKEYPVVQIRIRSETYPWGYNKAKQIFALLHRQNNVLATLRGRCFALSSEPLYLGHGENGECLFSQNYTWYLSSSA
jgi:hypothetical protein